MWMFFSLCIAYFLAVIFVVWPRMIRLRLARPTLFERQQLDLRVLAVIFVIAVILGVALAIWLAMK